MQGNNHVNTVLCCMITFLLGLFFMLRVFNDGVPGWKHIITSDGRGYYAYLPALLIDHDPSFASVAEREARLLGYAHYKPGYLVQSGSTTLNKYFAGEALLLLPFFLLGSLFSFLAGTALDGYSFFFQVFAGIGALFYLFSGLFFLRRILESLRITPFVTSLTLVAITLGTNLFYYSLWQPTMSHVFSFFAINGFMWFTIRAMQNWNIATALRMGIFLGLVCLVRPTNLVVILLIPYLAGDRPRFLHFIRQVLDKKSALLSLAGISMTVVALQGVLWYLQTGRFIVWSYQDEGFNFGNPEIFNVLFSYRKGLFVYTPIVLVSLAGLVPLMRKKWWQLLSMALFLVLSTYITASWWNWYYGDGFGLRAFIDFYGIFAILLALAMNAGRQMVYRYLYLVILSPFLVLNLVQTWQYTHQVIQPNSMNGAKYHHIWMRTDSAVINCLGGNMEIANYAINLAQPVKVFANDFEKPAEDWYSNTIIPSSRAFSGKLAGYLDSLNQFSPGISTRPGRWGNLPDEFYVTGELMVWDSLPGSSNGSLIVLSMDSIHPGENYWRGVRLNDIPVQTGKSWRKIRFALMLPEISNENVILKIYVWNTGKKPMLVDDFSVRMYGRKRGNR